MKRTFLLFFIIILSFFRLSGQDTINLVTNIEPKTMQLVSGSVMEGDTVIHIVIQQINVIPPFQFKSERQRRRYSRLVRYVKKVYPYAILIGQKYQEIGYALDSIHDEKERKKFIKKKEKELRAEFEDELVHLTILQGRILIKLVDRQTGATTYDVVKEFKGSFSAFFWQSLARLFGSNLKSEYEADGDDAMIEDIIFRIENGQL